ncbi:endolysin [Propionibacterium phage PFR2]|uniref:lysozyme n=2 Tax=Pulverervirus PFR1 TaxID=2170091 RepID=A0A173G9G9_9CAUD|nr:glycoside hydrolase family 25 protein [Propionibacterium freudenreichii]YP_009287697.1 endolysin [Propionibacterium phage PFR1]YP_009290930.1 endolysin [Propionibacterium phage PFR2]ANH49886.1 hypothetical protein PFR1_21 [Propionibacterium phage PFR1]ANH49946.1 hypothetical protein PFR2_21 [Propionibacterium phage PFR2]MDK9674452.1 glycoside hydrolase family 25 protein [Propionibacterium freudenreichii]CEI46760.1 Lysozyme [Propionibacterium freudenreichii]SCQ46766.1 Lysozyme M1 (1,4-beta
MDRGIDVSAYQAPDGGLLEGMSFCIIKATEGTGYTNPNRAQWYKVATDRGVTTGAYHFMRGGDPVQQADYFLDNLPGDVGWLALDVEADDDGLEWSGRVGFILAWTDRVKTASAKPTLVYCSRSWANALWEAATSDQRTRLTALPLWLADYTGTPGTYSGPVPDGWPVTMHQFTSTPIDTNALFADILQGGDTMTPELAARLDQIVAWQDANFKALAAQADANRDTLAQWTVDRLKETAASIPNVDTDKIAAQLAGAKLVVQLPANAQLQPAPAGGQA